MKLFSVWLDSILVNADVDSGWRTFFFGLQAIIIPAAIIGLSGRKWSTYGLSFKDGKSQIQSRINEGYGRPWNFFGVSFGPGLLIVSLLFGLSHIIQFGVFNPFLGQYDINPWMGLQASLGGFFYGLIREKSESIVSSGIAHGVPNVFGQVLSMALR